MAKKTGNDELVVKEPNELMLPDMEADAGQGFEEADAQAFAIPFFRIIQKMSPQLDSDSPLHNPKAKAGMFHNSVTDELFDGDEGVLAIPCYYRRSFIQWADINSGGGFMGEHPVTTGLINQTHRDENGRDVLDDGSYLADTRSHAMMVQNKGGSWGRVMMPLTSTQLKKSRQWMTKMNTLAIKNKDGALFNPAMFAQVYKLTTIGESNKKGTWKGVKTEYVGLVSDLSVYNQAKAFRDQVVAGIAKPNYEGPASDIAGVDNTDQEAF